MCDGIGKNVKPYSPEEDFIWWKMGDSYHQSITIYSCEDAARKHREELEEFWKNGSSEYSIKMVDETMGSLLSQLSEL